MSSKAEASGSAELRRNRLCQNPVAAISKEIVLQIFFCSRARREVEMRLHTATRARDNCVLGVLEMVLECLGVLESLRRPKQAAARTRSRPRVGRGRGGLTQRAGLTALGIFVNRCIFVRSLTPPKYYTLQPHPTGRFDRATDTPMLPIGTDIPFENLK